MQVRLFCQFVAAEENTISFTEAHAHYLRNVLRLEEGAEVFVFNGDAGEWCCRLVCVTKRDVRGVLTHQTRPKEMPTPALIAMLAPIKPARFEIAIEKLTELGVTAIQPVVTERTHYRHLNMSRIQAQSIEATEQSHRLNPPAISPLQPLPALLTAWPENMLLVVGDERLASGEQQKVSEDAILAIQQAQEIAVLVGPEGGFTEEEFALLEAHPASRRLRFGETILRAETAAIALCVMVQLLRRQLHVRSGR